MEVQQELGCLNDKDESNKHCGDGLFLTHTELRLCSKPGQRSKVQQLVWFFLINFAQIIDHLNPVKKKKKRG